MVKIYFGEGNRKQYKFYEKASWYGGEGELFEIYGQSDLVGKVLNDEPEFRESKKRKLEAMLLDRNCKNLMNFVIWPKDLLYENGKFCGYIMSKVSDAVELYEFNSDKYKLKTKVSSKVAVALNLAAAVDAVHKAGHIVGDFNSHNIMVSKLEGRVYLVDADSFLIVHPNTKEIFPCVAKTEEYWAPELFRTTRKNMSTHKEIINYTKETDNFALAVHIFRILMYGYHPFRCGKAQNVPFKSTIDNIKENFSPYFETRPGYFLPNGAPKSLNLPTEVIDAFKRAFYDGFINPERRPKANEWNQILSKMYNEGENNSSIWENLRISMNKIKRGLNIDIQKPLLKVGVVSIIGIISMLAIFGIFDYASKTDLSPVIPDNRLGSVEKINTDTNNTTSTGMVNNKGTQIPSDAFVWNGHSYYIFNNVVDYLGAKRYCESRGGYLATIGSKAENDAIYSYIRSKDIKTAYFGLTDEKKEGVWTWVNGERLTYTNWHRDEPNGGTSENHAMFYYKYPDGKWNDENLSKYTVESERYFICEWDVVNQKQVDNKVNVIENASTQPEYNKSKVKIVPESTEIKVVTTNPVSKKKRLIGSDEYNEFHRKYKPTNDIGSKKYLEIGETAYLYSESAFKAYNTATFKEEMKIVNNVRLIQRAVKIEDRRNIAPFGKAILKDDIKGEFFNTSGVYKLYNVKDDTPCEVAHKINGEYFCGFTMNGELWCKWIKEDKLKPEKKEFWYEINIPGDNTNDTYWVSGLYLSKLKKRK